MHVFSVIDSDIGNVTSNQMNIKLQNKNTFQLNYDTVLKVLYVEL